MQTTHFAEAIHLLGQRKPLIDKFNIDGEVHSLLKVPVYEFVEATQTKTKVYFDIDAPLDTVIHYANTQELLNRYALANVISVALNIPVDKVGSICYTPSTKKISLHITLLYNCTRQQNRAAAEILGKELEKLIIGFRPEFVDKAVYGRSQKFRAIYTSKRGENRFKQPIPEFDLEDIVARSLITIVPDEDFPHTLICGISKKLPPKLNWFRTALEHKELGPLWNSLKDVYDSWYTVGATLWVEVSQHPTLYEEGLALFLRFTADNKWRDEAVHKWRTAFTTQEKDLWNKIRKWVMDFCEPTGKELDRLFKGSTEKLVTSLNYQATQQIYRDNEDFQLASSAIDFRLTTRTQYIVWHQLTHSEKFYRYWDEKFAEAPDMSHLIALLESDPAKIKYIIKLKSAEEAFGTSLRPDHLPYGKLYLQDDLFLKWVRTEFNLPEPEEKMEINEETLSLAQLNFYQICLDTDPEYTETVFKATFPVSFLGSREYRDPAQTIRQIILQDSLYQTQYPYKTLLTELFDGCDKNWDLFWLALSKFSREFLFVERIFHLLTNAIDDNAAAESVISLYPFWRKGPTGSVYVYDDTEGFWTTDESIKLGIITRFSSFLETTTPRGVVNSATSDSKRRSVLKFIESSETIRSKGATLFMETKKTGLYKFLFRNGYYNGIEDKFYPKTTVVLKEVAETFFSHVNVVFFGKIDNDYQEINEELAEIMADMNEKMFLNMHGIELGTYWKQCLSMALFGVRKKGFFEHVGDTNSGKSTEMDMITNAFGSFVQQGATQNFVNQPHDMRSIERQMGWLVPVWFKRLYMCSERTSVKDTCNTERMKGISSGQKDQHQVSQLYEKAQTVEVHFIVSFYINKPLTWDNPKDPALIDRRNVITWFRTYVDHVTDPNTQLLKDPNTQNWATSRLHQMAYIHLIIGAFKDLINRGYNMEKEIVLPKPSVIMDSEQAQETVALSTEELFEQLLQWVIVTGDPTHNIPMSELDEILQTNLDQIASKQKVAIKSYLQSFGVQCESKQVRRNSLKIRVMSGMYARSTKAQDYSLLADLEQWKALVTKFNGTIGPQTMLTLKKVEELVQSSGQLTFLDIGLIEEWASESQKNYFENHNSFQNHKRRRVDNE